MKHLKNIVVFEAKGATEEVREEAEKLGLVVHTFDDVLVAGI